MLNRRHFLQILGVLTVSTLNLSNREGAEGTSLVALIKGSDRRRNIREALRIIEKDIADRIRGKILIKPNLTSVTKPLAATHADAIRGVLDVMVDMVSDPIVIAEGAGYGNTFEGYKNFGYFALSKEYPVFLIDLLEGEKGGTIPVLTVDNQTAEAGIYREAADYGCIVSLALPKTHKSTIATLGLKNMMGCVVRNDRKKLHGYLERDKEDFSKSVKVIHKNIIRMAQKISPTISIIDGFVGMEGEGPINGNEVKLGVAIASCDFVAADAVAAKVMGFEPLEIGYIYYAQKLGLGVGALHKIRIIGDKIENVQKKFNPPSSYLMCRKFLP
jgi:uncharacterized protein (DUF362 family)